MTPVAGTRTAAPSAHHHGVRPGLLLVAIVLVAANLRPAIVAVPPLLGPVRADLALSATAASLLTTLPVLCMGVFAPLGAVVNARLGSERAVSLALVLVAAGCAARGLPGGAAVLFAATTLVGVGLAMGGALLPGVVKSGFAERAGAVTGLYTAALVGGAVAASVLSVPLLGAVGGGWRPALALWALPALAALGAWLPVTRGMRHARAARPASAVAPGRSPWRSGVAWRAAGYVGGQSLLFYGTLAWLPAVYVDLGWSAARAGLLLGLFMATQVVSSLALPLLSGRTGNRRPWILGCLVTTLVGLVVLATAPDASPWVLAGVLGFTIGGQFALGLVLLVELAPDPRAAGRLSGMVLCVGYVVAASGPLLMGALIDATGAFTVAFLALASVCLPTLAAGVSLRPGRTV